MEKDRKYSLKKPPGHKVPVPRWHLKLPDGVTHTYTLYIGLQSHEASQDTISKATKSIRAILRQTEGQPAAIDTFRVTNGFDVVGSKVWVAYWTDFEAFSETLDHLDLKKIWHDLGEGRDSVGLWCEHFTTPLDRLETNYARLEHKPGLAQIPNSEQPSHDRTGYWGAGRDRIPASADDRFDFPSDIAAPKQAPKGRGEYIFGTNYDNMCHIRSGQYWVSCDQPERESYENSLEPALMGGMQYLWDNPVETGTLGLRFLQNTDKDDNPIKETCGAGFHRNWADLERWSSRHPSHLKIFNGAMRHAKEFGEERKFMTWHEVSILKKGEVGFEYVNVDPTTGVIRWVPLQVESLKTSRHDT